MIAPRVGSIRSLSRRAGIAIAGLFMLSEAYLEPDFAFSQSPEYASAEALVRNHLWDEGLAALQPLLKREPHNPRDLNLAGLAHTGKGDLQQADAYFKQAIAARPDFVPAIKNLAVNEFNEGQIPSAEKHLVAAAKLAPSDPVLNLYLGEIHYRDLRYRQAADEFGRARQLVSGNAVASAHLAVSYLWSDRQQSALEIVDGLPLEQLDPRTQFALGVALEQSGLPERADLFLEAVHRTYPNSYDFAYDLMLASIASKNYARAIEVGKQTIALGLETSELNNILAEAYAGDNQIQPAVDSLRRAIALDPEDEDNYLDFASLCMNQRSLQAGMTVLQVAIQTHPKSDRLIFMRGLMHAMQDEFALAEQDFKLSADLSPQKNLGYIGLGISYLETGHDEEAINVLRQRLRAKPDDASLLYLLGEALIRTGASNGTAAKKEAQTVLEKSVRLNPNLCLTHISLGGIYLDEDRPLDAIQQFEKAREIDPKERSAYSHLAVAYRAAGQTGKAKEVLTTLQNMIVQERQSTRDRLKEQADRTTSQTEPSGGPTSPNQ